LAGIAAGQQEAFAPGEGEAALMLRPFIDQRGHDRAQPAQLKGVAGLRQVFQLLRAPLPGLCQRLFLRRQEHLFHRGEAIVQGRHRHAGMLGQ
jgi:hypothetical protein